MLAGALVAVARVDCRLATEPLQRVAPGDEVLLPYKSGEEQASAPSDWPSRAQSVICPPRGRGPAPGAAER
jgi:hypothetical protein